eukprot:scaffold22151_cov38-Prasinocladus_malaysianus.AAC.2
MATQKDFSDKNLVVAGQTALNLSAEQSRKWDFNSCAKQELWLDYGTQQARHTPIISLKQVTGVSERHSWNQSSVVGLVDSSWACADTTYQAKLV